MLSKADVAKLSAIVDLPPYAGKSDGEVANVLSIDSTTTGTKLIPVNVLLDKLIEIGVYSGLDAKRGTDSTSRMVLGFLANPHVNMIDLSKPGPLAMLGGLEAKGNLSVAQKAAIMSLGTCFISEGEKVVGQGKRVSHIDIARARGRG